MLRVIAVWIILAVLCLSVLLCLWLRRLSHARALDRGEGVKPDNGPGNPTASAILVNPIEAEANRAYVEMTRARPSEHNGPTADLTDDDAAAIAAPTPAKTPEQVKAEHAREVETRSVPLAAGGEGLAALSAAADAQARDPSAPLIFHVSPNPGDFQRLTVYPPAEPSDPMKLYLQPFTNERGKPQWHLLGGNYRILAHSEEYSSKKKRDQTVGRLAARTGATVLEERRP